ncbi:hypothetical protein H6P81_004551 [Aristolochia fimbriata]|uniref:Uncharacterized protein n=1 Tax=Aristolochia fimbriata TaxID=158543 RepID=A0AAV7FFV3_ARIFI|nr:hypothetical protein H6P81_004551 [Aristolochia fimbriata]
MPTFTAAALERLIDPGDTTTSHTKTKSSSLKQLKTQNGNNVPIPGKSSRLYFSPALYTTPDPTPVPDFPASSPSPYVYNRKRRDFSRRENPSLGAQTPCRAPVEEAISLQPQDHDQLSPNTPIVPEAAPSSASPPSSAHQPDGDEHRDRDDNLSSTQEFVYEPSGESHLKGCSDLDDDFFAPHASLSVVSDEGGNPTRDCWRYASDMSQSEFYDAREEFFSDGSSCHSSPSSDLNIEAELRAIRFSLLEEIRRRKLAEQAVADMCEQWHLIGQKMSELGISSDVVTNFEEMGPDVGLADQLCEEVVVARVVAEAVGRGCARAEWEAAAEAIVNSKNHEITRLRDKLQYYEAVNQEMSLRNQEIVETARQGRLRRKRRLRWMWTCIGTSFVFGASVLSYLYLPRPVPEESPLACEDSGQRGGYG